MNPRERHLGTIALASDDGSFAGADVGALVRRLLLFEHCVLESRFLAEVPSMVQAFGFSGLMRLLDEPDLTIICDAVTVGSTGQWSPPTKGSDRTIPLPLGSYQISTVAHHEAEEPFATGLANVKGLWLSDNQIRKLKRKFENKLQTYSRPGVAGGGADLALRAQTSPSSIAGAIADDIRAKLDLSPNIGVRVELEVLPGPAEYKISTNLTADHGVEPERAHKVVEKSILGIHGMYQRLGLMQHYTAVSGFRNEELPYFSAHLDYLINLIDPNRQEERLERVVSLFGLPQLDGIRDGVTVDVAALLKLRHEPDCRALRAWLRGIDGTTDQDLSAQYGAIQERVSKLVHGAAGKSIRFLATTGLSMIPGLGALPTALSASDTFLIDRLVRKPGPMSFLGSSYPSIFGDPRDG